MSEKVLTAKSVYDSLWQLIEIVGPDQFLKWVDNGLLDMITPSYQQIWKDVINDIIEEQKAAEQYAIENDPRGT
jgi:hypothetical protein